MPDFFALLIVADFRRSFDFDDSDIFDLSVSLLYRFRLVEQYLDLRRSSRKPVRSLFEMPDAFGNSKKMRAQWLIVIIEKRPDVVEEYETVMRSYITRIWILSSPHRSCVALESPQVLQQHRTHDT